MTAPKLKHSTLNAALVAAQKATSGATKNSLNPQFKTYFADLASVIEAVKGPLNDNGLSLTQELHVETVGTGDATQAINTLHTIIRWEGGEEIDTSVKVPHNDNIQKWGASITYLKRYALQALLLLPTEDDDGESLQDRPPVKSTASRFGKK